MSTQPANIRIGDVEVTVEAVKLPGSQPTSKIGRAGGQVVDTFEQVRETVVAIAAATVEAGMSAAVAARPHEVEVEFGLKFTASGGVIVAGGSAEANLALRLKWTNDVRDATSSAGSASPSGTDLMGV